MANKNISLPDAMSTWIDNQVHEGRYHNASEYVRDLIRHDMDDRAEIAALRRTIQESEASGISDHSLEEIFDQARREARRDAKPKDA